MNPRYSSSLLPRFLLSLSSVRYSSSLMFQYLSTVSRLTRASRAAFLFLKPLCFSSCIFLYISQPFNSYLRHSSSSLIGEQALYQKLTFVGRFLFALFGRFYFTGDKSRNRGKAGHIV